MAATWLSIVDTAVKIGLGAAISGIATYSITRYKQKSDKELKQVQRKIDSLDIIAEQTEEFSHVCLNYWARILDWSRKKEKSKPISDSLEKELKAVRTELFNSYKTLASAESKLLLMGENKAAELLRFYGEQLTRFYSTVFIGNHNVPISDIEEWRVLILSERELVFNELSRIYKSL